MTDSATSPVRTWGTSVAAVRIATGFIQGVALYLLFRADEAKAWVATEQFVFVPLVTLALLVPLIVIQGAGAIRIRTLLVWVAVAALLAVGLAAHDVFSASDGIVLARTAPWFFFPALVAWFFIAQALIAAGDTERRVIASYTAYYEVAWKQAIQVAAGGVFVGLFWLLLRLGAELFKLVKLDFFDNIISSTSFAIPATAIALAVAIHVTDVRPGIVRGMRTLVLTLMSWLLPLMVLIVGGFLLTLPFTGLEPLWGTNFAAALLLVVAAALVVLLNAAYQDGAPDHGVPKVLRYAGTGGALLLVPLVTLAAYALMLRVGQYGWSKDRVIASACILVAACYALGYAWAALSRDGWLKRLEICNVATAFVVLAVLLALFSPIADPARIAVGSQVARLVSGKTPVDKFDFTYLRFDTGRYGIEALQKLGQGNDVTQIAGLKDRATEALKWQTRVPADSENSESLIAKFTVAPPGRQLPESFVKQEWRGKKNMEWIPECLQYPSPACDAALIDLNGDKIDEIVLIPPGGNSTVFTLKDGTWSPVAQVESRLSCPDMRARIMDGDQKVVPPQWHHLEVAGKRIAVTDLQEWRANECPGDGRASEGQ